MSETGALGEIAEDRLLDGRLRLMQPVKGHRAGSDAILLAASLPELGDGPLLDMGAGVGTIGLAAALHQESLHVTLLERDPDLVALARRNAEANGLGARVTVVAGDIAARAADLAQLGLASASFACVAINPPFYRPGAHRPSPVANRRAAHVTDVGLDGWIATARRMLRPKGQLALIHQAEALPEILALLGRGFGAVEIRPVHGLASRPAIRVLVTARLGSKKPAALLPAFVLNREEGGFTPESEAVHRGLAFLGPSAPQ